MEAIFKTAVVKGGKLEIDVDAPDGTEFDVTLHRAKEADERRRILERAASLRDRTKGPGEGQDALKRYASEGRA